MILWQWLWAVRRPNAEKLQKAWYLPINRDELFILVSLLLIVCMAELEERDPGGGRVLRCPQKIVRPVKGLGLEIKLPENRDRFPQSMSVYLKHKHAKCANMIDVSNSRGEAGPGSDVKHKRIYLFVSIPSCNFWENERRLNIVSESDKSRNSIKTLWVSNQKTISAEDLIEQSGSPEKIKQDLWERFMHVKPRRANVRLEKLQPWGKK